VYLHCHIRLRIQELEFTILRHQDRKVLCSNKVDYLFEENKVCIEGRNTFLKFLFYFTTK